MADKIGLMLSVAFFYQLKIICLLATDRSIEALRSLINTGHERMDIASMSGQL